MKSNRKLTYVFLIIGCVSLIFAFILGIADNPPGIVLLYLGTISLILSLIHKWQRFKKFKILTLVSIISIPVFIILYNLFYGLSKMSADISLLASFLNLLSIFSFFLALIICPVGLVIGLGGMVIIRKKGGKN